MEKWQMVREGEGGGYRVAWMKKCSGGAGAECDNPLMEHEGCNGGLPGYLMMTFPRPGVKCTRSTSSGPPFSVVCGLRSSSTWSLALSSRGIMFFDSPGEEN